MPRDPEGEHPPHVIVSWPPPLGQPPADPAAGQHRRTGQNGRWPVPQAAPGQAGAGPCAAAHRLAAGSRSARARRRPSRCGPRPPIPAGTRNRYPGARPGGRLHARSQPTIVPPTSRTEASTRSRGSMGTPASIAAAVLRSQARRSRQARSHARPHVNSLVPLTRPTYVPSMKPHLPGRASRADPGRDAPGSGASARYGPVVSRDPLCTPR